MQKDFVEIRPDWLRREYVDLRRSTQSIADGIGVNRNTIRNRLIEFGIERRGKAAHFKGVTKPDSQRLAMSRARRAMLGYPPDYPPRELGVTQGRRFIYVPGRGKVFDYTIAAEDKIGRRLKDGEIVHHIDGNSLNCNPDNLQVMTQAEHAKLHAQMRKGSQIKNKTLKLTQEIARDIRAAYVPRKVTRIDLAKKFGVHKSCINKILAGETWAE